MKKLYYREKEAARPEGEMIDLSLLVNEKQASHVKERREKRETALVSGTSEPAE